MGKYLTLTEGSDYYDITCDGYNAFLVTNDDLGDTFIRIETNAVTRCNILEGLGDDYFIARDDSRVTTIIENTPTRVVAQVTGKFENNSSTYLQDGAANADIEHVTTVTFYSDRFFVTKTFIIDGTLTHSDSNHENPKVDGSSGDLTNETSIYDISSTEEDSGDNYTSKTGNYIGLTSDEINWQMIIVSDNRTGDAGLLQSINNTEEVILDLRDGTVLNGDSYTYCIIIDSAEREGSAKLYDSSDRLEQGIQYTNPRAVEEYNPDVTFYWDCESADSKIPDTPLTATVLGDAVLSTTQVVAGTYSLYIPTTHDFYYYDIDTDIFSTQGSLSFWFYSTAYPYVLIAVTNSSGEEILRVEWQSNDLLRSYWHNGTSLSYRDSGNSVIESSWNHARVVWNSDSLTSYLNGVASTSLSITATSRTPERLYIGDRYYQLTNPYYIDQVYITNDPDSTNLYKPTTGEWVSDNAIAKYEGAGFSKDGAYHVRCTGE